jgi:hypothetical protein
MWRSERLPTDQALVLPSTRALHYPTMKFNNALRTSKLGEAYLKLIATGPQPRSNLPFNVSPSLNPASPGIRVCGVHIPVLLTAWMFDGDSIL